MKKEWKWKNVTVILEKIKPDWKVALVWVILIVGFIWFIWYR